VTGGTEACRIRSVNDDPGDENAENNNHDHVGNGAIYAATSEIVPRKGWFEMSEERTRGMHSDAHDKLRKARL
jgi:hypothetical protein